MSKERCIIDCDMLKVSAMINFASSKYFVVSARMVSPFFGSLLTAVASRYPKSCRNDSASTSLKVWRRSTIHSTMSLRSVFEFTFGLQLVIVRWLQVPRRWMWSCVWAWDAQLHCWWFEQSMSLDVFEDISCNTIDLADLETPWSWFHDSKSMM